MPDILAPIAVSTQVDGTQPDASDLTASSAPPPVAPAQQAQPVAASSPIGITSEQLKSRLDETREKAAKAERAAVLKEIGVSSIEEAAAASKAAREALEAQKSELQRLSEQREVAERERAALAAKVAELEPVVALRADAEFTKLSAEQQAAVVALAGDDKAQRLRVISALASTWSVGAAPSPSPPAALPPPPTTPPATTSAAGNSPASAATSAPANHRAQYEALKQSNPTAAALYLGRHAKSIYPNT